MTDYGVAIVTWCAALSTIRVVVWLIVKAPPECCMALLVAFLLSSAHGACGFVFDVVTVVDQGAGVRRRRLG